MADAPARRVVVVDGSNLATEGRTSPSLRQLDEAVRAYAQEDPEAEIVVVVDASFEHRIDASEREQLVDAELHGELVSPPAGAIGRGDAFVLRIAERTGARVLSNDSFQEFHAQHPWLFDQGRLVGGKPVPGVGWIFTPRLPVRGPKSKEVTGRARRAASALEPPEKAAELAKAAKKAAQRAEKAAAKRVPAVLPDGTVPKVGDVWRPAAGPASAVPPDASASDGAAASTPSGRRTRSDKGAKRSDARAAPSRGDGAQAEVDGARAPRRRRRGAPPEEPARAAAAAATPAPTSPAAPRGRKARREEAEVAAPPAGASRRGRRATEPEAEPPSPEAGAAPGKKRGAAKTAPTKKRGAAKTAPTKTAATKAAAAPTVRARTAATGKEAGPGGAAKEEPARKPPAGASEKKSAKKTARAGRQAGGAEGAEARADAAPARAPRAKRAKAAAQVAPAPSRGAQAQGAPGTPPATRRAGRTRGEEVPTPAAGRARDDPAVRRAIDDALAEVASPGDAGGADGRRPSARGGRGGADGASAPSEPGAARRRRATPPPAVNEPLAFITFVAAHPLHTEVEGEVVSFTSHGAMVDVDLPDGGTLHCYIPLSAMGEPPPTKAREVLTRGERRGFVLVGLDPPRRVAELALPGVADPAPPAEPAAPSAGVGSVGRRASRRRPPAS